MCVICQLYKYLDTCLKLEKDMDSIIYIISRLEQSYEEEEMKMLANGILLGLLNIKDELHTAVQEFDQHILDTKKSSLK